MVTGCRRGQRPLRPASGALQEPAVAGLTDSGTDGRWAESLLAGDSLAAPHLMPVEAANILRRAALAGDIGADVASLAHSDLLDLRVEFFPYEPCAECAAFIPFGRMRLWTERGGIDAVGP
jgi:hypothetical protein